MRVDMNQEADFCAELEAEAANIHHKIVRVRIERQPEQREGISHTVTLWATTLVQTAEGTYLVEYVEECGRDVAKNNSMDGTTRAQETRKRIEETCQRLGLQLRGGKLEPGI